MKNRSRILIQALVVAAATFCVTWPTFPAEGGVKAAQEACIAAPTEDCVLALIAQAADWRASPAAEANYYANLGRSYGLAGREAKAQSYFSQAIAIAEIIDDPELQSRSLYSIGNGMADVGDWQGAVGIFRRLPDSLGIPIPMSFRAWQLADVGEFELAFEMAMRLPHPSKRPDYLRHLAERQAEAGDIVGAWRSFWAILPDSVTTLQNVEALFAGRPEGLPVNVFVPLAAIAAAEMRAGNVDAATALEKLPHRGWESFPGITARVAEALADGGQLDEALRKVSGIEDRRGKNAALQMISERLAAKHTWDRASQVVTMIDIEEQAFSAMLRLAELEAQSGALSEAVFTYDTAMADNTMFLRHLVKEQLEATRLAIAVALTLTGDTAAAEPYYDAVLMPLPWRNVDRQVRSLSYASEVLSLIGKVATARYEAGDVVGAASLVGEAAALRDPNHKARNSDEKWLARTMQNDSARELLSLAHMQAQVGLTGPALATALAAMRPSDRFSALSAVLRAVLEGKAQ